MSDNLILLKNEEILFESRTINKLNKIIMGLPIFIIIFFLILCFYIDYLFLIYPPPLKSFYLLLLFNSLLIGGILLSFIGLETMLREIRNTYFITNKRVIKRAGTTILFKIPHLNVIYLEDIAFIQTDDFIHVVQKGPRGELHYNKNDISYYDLLSTTILNIIKPKNEYIKIVDKIERQSSQIGQKSEFNNIICEVKRIWFDIKGKHTIQIRKKIINLLADLISLEKHPHLENAYLNTSKKTQENSKV